MAPLRTQVLVRGDVRLMGTLERWAARAGQSEGAMLAISEYMEGEEKKLFASQGASAGRPWAPLATSTVAEKARQNESGGILQATGDLEASLTSRGSPHAIREIGPGWLRFGTKLAYAAIVSRVHNPRGGSGVMVPARRAIDWTAKNRYVITQLMGDWITGKVNKNILPSIRTYRGPFL